MSNSYRAKWKVISPSGNEAMVPSVCFSVPPPNKEATEMASRWRQSGILLYCFIKNKNKCRARICFHALVVGWMLRCVANMEADEHEPAGFQLYISMLDFPSLTPPGSSSCIRMLWLCGITLILTWRASCPGTIWWLTSAPSAKAL